MDGHRFQRHNLLAADGKLANGTRLRSSPSWIAWYLHAQWQMCSRPLTSPWNASGPQAGAMQICSTMLQLRPACCPKGFLACAFLCICISDACNDERAYCLP